MEFFVNKLFYFLILAAACLESIIGFADDQTNFTTTASQSDQPTEGRFFSQALSGDLEPDGNPLPFPSRPPGIHLGLNGNNPHYFPTVLVNQRRVNAEDLLPTAVKAMNLYGYSLSTASVKANCFISSIWIARPELAGNYNVAWNEGMTQLAPGQTPTTGDIAVLFWRSTSDPAFEYGFHAVVYISAQLVWSKAGFGTSNPLFLRPFYEVRNQYANDPPYTEYYVTVKYFRKN